MANKKGSGGGKAHRSAETGKFVTKGQAAKNPRTTVSETRSSSKKKSPSKKK